MAMFSQVYSTCTAQLEFLLKLSSFMMFDIIMSLFQQKTRGRDSRQVAAGADEDRAGLAPAQPAVLDERGAREEEERRASLQQVQGAAREERGTVHRVRMHCWLLTPRKSALLAVTRKSALLFYTSCFDNILDLHGYVCFVDFVLYRVTRRFPL